MKKLHGAICGVLLLCFTATPGSAEDIREQNMGTITVTAQKQEEDIQDVPMSISVLNEQNIEDRMIDSVVEIADFVPNLTIFENGASGMNSPSTRGIHAFVESMIVSTGLFVDGLPLLSAAGFEDTLIDIERVEVLRGPQGTLYGKNTEAGAINIITRQPDNDFRGRISSQLGEDDKRQFTLNLSGPVMQDRLFVGLAGKYFEKDGYIENTLTGEEVDDRRHWYGRGQLRWTPTENLDISLILSRLEYDDGVNNMNMTEAYAAMFGLPAPEDRKIATNFGENKTVDTSQVLKLIYHFSDSLKLTSITSNKKYDDNRESDWDFNPIELIHTKVDSEYNKVSQELRLDSSAGKLNWLVGIYYDRDDNDVVTEQMSVYPTMRSTSDRDFEGDGYAFFGQANYLFWGKFRLTAGLRFERQEVEFTDHVRDYKEKKTWDEISPKIALDYKITPQIMAYASVSKGYRSGGFNTYATNPLYTTYDEEKLWSYEVGLKTMFMDQRLILNGTLFYMDIKDMQVNEAISPTEAYLTNAAEATSMGAEIDITARLTKELSLMGSFGYTNIEFDDFKDTSGDYEGNKNPYAPEYTYNVAVQYRSSMGLYIRGDLIGCGKVYLDKANEYSRDPYEIVNAKIGYETEHFDLYLYGKNIFDREYDSVGMFNGLYTLYSEPREIGIQLTYRY